MATGIEHLPTTSEYAEIARRPLEAERCALIVIDIQEKLLPPIFQREQLVRNSQLLIRAAGILKIPALLFRSPNFHSLGANVVRVRPRRRRRLRSVEDDVDKFAHRGNHSFLAHGFDLRRGTAKCRAVQKVCSLFCIPVLRWQRR